MKIQGRDNDLIERLKGDKAFGGINFTRLLRPRDFVGRAPEQVGEFLREVVGPIRRKYRKLLGGEVKLKV